jgi:hypothetical protein
MKTPAVVLFSILSMTLAACSASVDGGPGNFDIPVPQKPDVFEKPAIKGPNVIGAWQTDCVTAGVYSGSRKARIEYTSVSDFRYTNVKYVDRACEIEKSTDSHAGLYQFSQKVSDAVYVIDYNYLVDKVTYKMNGQHLEVAGDTIYISEFVFGNTEVTHDVPFKKVTGAAPTPVPVPGPAPTSCQSYVGEYQMNSDSFKISQEGCTKFVWTWLPTYQYPNEEKVEYITDGVPRQIGTTVISASYDAQGRFTRSYTSSSGQKVLEVYNFSKRPCNLMNPDGADHLTREVSINGQTSDSYCKFWDRH